MYQPKISIEPNTSTRPVSKKFKLANNSTRLASNFLIPPFFYPNVMGKFHLKNSKLSFSMPNKLHNMIVFIMHLKQNNNNNNNN